MTHHSGIPIVLTADRTLMARYDALFDGMLAASQTTTTPAFLMTRLLAPALSSDGLRARRAPLGLRRVEAALARAGWRPDDAAIVRPEDLPAAVGPATRLIGLSAGDPAGAGMNTATMEGLAGGENYPARWFRRLAARVQRLRRAAPDAKVVVGGPGAWQLADPERRAALGADHVILGYCEANVAELVQRILDRRAPAVLEGRSPAADDIPPLRGPTVMGAVEVSRGCGLGCAFCTIGRSPMTHLPLDLILADVETNAAAGVGAIALVTEDLFRYRARGFRVRPDAVMGLLDRVRRVRGVRMVQTDHANLASLAGFTDAELSETARLFRPEGRRHDFVWLNLGVETASGALLAANSGRAKMGPFAPEDWGEASLEQVRRAARSGFFPLVSLLLGLPGETPDDVLQTIRWVERLRDERAAVFPLFYAPIDGRSRPFTVSDMTPAHWRLMRLSYELNFKWIPRLAWDNQRAAGGAWARRALIQMLGRGNILWWKALLAWRARRATPR